jgi:hypothetical protein
MVPTKRNDRVEEAIFLEWDRQRIPHRAWGDALACALTMRRAADRSA